MFEELLKLLCSEHRTVLGVSARTWVWWESPPGASCLWGDIHISQRLQQVCVQVCVCGNHQFAHLFSIWRLLLKLQSLLRTILPLMAHGSSLCWPNTSWKQWPNKLSSGSAGFHRQLLPGAQHGVMKWKAGNYISLAGHQSLQPAGLVPEENSNLGQIVQG